MSILRFCFGSCFFLCFCLNFTAQAQLNRKMLETLQKLPDLKCLTLVKNHGLITNKGALVQQGLRIYGACRECVVPKEDSTMYLELTSGTCGFASL